jgi:peptide/nickel transport system substrate-binding protein
MDPVRDVIADDDYTIRIILHYPYAPIMANLAHVCSAILPEKAVTERGAGFSTNPIGTGSMRFVEMIPGDRVILERYEGYHGVVARAPRIVFRTMPEEGARSIALETGEIDFDPEVAPPNVARVVANPNLRLHSWPSIFTEFVMFNCKRPPFDNVLVRQAIAHVIDRETIIQIGVEGHGRSVETVLPIGVLGHTTDYQRYPRDPARGRELLARAGYPNGFNTVILVSGDLRTRKAVLVQANLAEIGIRAEIRTVEHAALMEAYGTGNYDISLSSWGNGTGDPEGSLYVVFYSAQQGVAGNRAWFEDPQVDYWLLRGRATLVESERAHAYSQATKLIMEQVPWVPLV